MKSFAIFAIFAVGFTLGFEAFNCNETEQVLDLQRPSKSVCLKEQTDLKSKQAVQVPFPSVVLTKERKRTFKAKFCSVESTPRELYCNYRRLPITKINPTNYINDVAVEINAKDCRKIQELDLFVYKGKILYYTTYIVRSNL